MGGPLANTHLTTLGRLATDSGGRMTELTNDLALGYKRASEDRACVYSLGIYVDEGQEDRPREVTIRARRPGLRVLHPSKFLFRSPSARKESLLRAAWSAPDLFETGIVRAHVFPLRPLDGGRWDSLLAVSFPVPVSGDTGDAGSRREFGAVLRQGSRVVTELNRSVTLAAVGSGKRVEPHVTFVARVVVKPGTYELTVVLSDPNAPAPHARRVALDVPSVPRKELFLVDSILGRPAGGNLVVFVGGSENEADALGGERSFEPLLIQRLDEPADFVSLTQACYVGAKKRKSVKAAADRVVSRALLDENGAEVGSLDPFELSLDGQDDVRCQSLVDVIPASHLRAGEYIFEAAVQPTPRDPGPPVRVRFVVAPL